MLAAEAPAQEPRDDRNATRLVSPEKHELEPISSPHDPPRSPGMTEVWWITLIKSFVIINLLLGTFAYTTLLERKAIARMQLRYGPNRAGPYGLLQPIADLVKLIRKEAFFPT